MNKTFIIVRWDLEGTHCWPKAPEEYAVLSSKHGHIFHFEALIPVTASRQIEFLEARRELIKAVRETYGQEPCDFSSLSCEDLANTVIAYIGRAYNCGAVVRVFEDTSVGAEVRGRVYHVW